MNLTAAARVLAALLTVSVIASCDRDDPLTGSGVIPEPPPVVPLEPDPGTVSGSIVISEIVPENTTYVDGSGAAPLGFVELQNLSPGTLELGGVSITFIPVDDGDSTFTIPFEQGFTIAPNEFVVVSLGGVMAGEADPDDLIASTDPPDATNSLATFQVFLDGAEPLGNVTIQTADIAPDVSFSRVTTPDGVFFVEVTAPTPNAPNTGPANPIPLAFIRGDVNGDEVVDMSDLDDLEPFVTNQPMLPNCQDALDVNDDGQINVVDVVFLAKALAGESGFEVPPPFASASTDPTVDNLTCDTVAAVPASVGGTP